MSNQVIGDPLPDQLLAYWTALDSGRFAAAADAFAPDCLYALPGPGLETQPRIETRGREALLRRFEQRGVLPRVHVPQLCVVEGRRCLVEGALADPEGRLVATFVTSVTLAADGLVERYLAYGCNGARDPIPTAVDSAPADALSVLNDYFHALDEGRFEDAADRFSEDVLYSHPPYRHTGIDSDDRVEFRGRPELLDAFKLRGQQSFGHRIIVCIQRGPHALLEGAVEDLPHGGSGSFISSLSLDADGRIQRYVSFYCEPSVP